VGQLGQEKFEQCAWGIKKKIRAVMGKIPEQSSSTSEQIPVVRARQKNWLSSRSASYIYTWSTWPSMLILFPGGWRLQITIQTKSMFIFTDSRHAYVSCILGNQHMICSDHYDKVLFLQLNTKTVKIHIFLYSVTWGPILKTFLWCAISIIPTNLR